MGLAHDAIRAVTLAAAAGLAAGGGIGILAPGFAEAGAAPARPVAAVRPVTVTSVDLLAGRRLEVTLRFVNTGRAVEYIDPAGLTVTADGAELAHLSDPRTAVVDLHPGATGEETVAFAAPSPAATLELRLPGGETLPLS
ncbi:hypothetical protein [Dactylosporangium sp. CA-139066]|uniref:hypothetical protein n=1 Tax=Dactylosporangium sp. CA-139066 TaxID=3239930 RepID=UPI003D8E8129